MRPSGGTSFVLLYKTASRSRRASLGAVASRRVDAVRRECHALIAERAPDGAINPAHEAPLFGDFTAGPWSDAHFPKYKPSTRTHASAALAKGTAACPVPAMADAPPAQRRRKRSLRSRDPSRRPPARARPSGEMASVTVMPPCSTGGASSPIQSAPRRARTWSGIRPSAPGATRGGGMSAGSIHGSNGTGAIFPRVRRCPSVSAFLH